ncbi:hypothetical protein D9M69_542150 [compost metagenome]
MHVSEDTLQTLIGALMNPGYRRDALRVSEGWLSEGILSTDQRERLEAAMKTPESAPPRFPMVGL